MHIRWILKSREAAERPAWFGQSHLDSIAMTVATIVQDRNRWPNARFMLKDTWKLICGDELFAVKKRLERAMSLRLSHETMRRFNLKSFGEVIEELNRLGAKPTLVGEGEAR
jgi:hypothetical protein